MEDLVNSNREDAGMPSEVYNCPGKDKNDLFGMLLWFIVAFCTLRILSVVHGSLQFPETISPFEFFLLNSHVLPGHACWAMSPSSS